MPTAAQTALTAGFRASLSQRGVSLSLDRTGATVSALIEPVPPTDGEYALDETSNLGAVLHLLRADYAAMIATLTPGDVFVDAANDFGYRVIGIDDDPLRVSVRLICESYKSSAL